MRAPLGRDGVRRGVRRVVVTLVAGLTVAAVAALIDLEPDVLAVVLATGLAVAGFTLLTESVTPYGPKWYPAYTADPLTRGRDGATFADLRLLESHQTARHPDSHLHRRLGVLADRALRATRGVGLDTEEGRAHLGPAVVRLLDGERRRLSPRDIELCLRTIEEL